MINPTAAFPVHTLTGDQALAELELLLDSKPGTDQPRELHHWKVEHADRVLQLEAWVMMHPAGAAAAPEPSAEPEPEPEDAPPHHLHADPEPPPAAPTPAEAPMPEPMKTTSITDKLEMQVRNYAFFLAKLQTDPGNQKLRNQASTAKSLIRGMERKHRLPETLLLPVPPLPGKEPKVAGAASPMVRRAEQFAERIQVCDPAPAVTHPAPEDLTALNHSAPFVAPEPEPAPIPAEHGAGPYQEPTAEEIRGMLPGRISFEPPAIVLTPSAREILRGIRREFWNLLAAMEDLDGQGRAALRKDLDLVVAQADQALALLDEDAIPQAG